MTPFGEHNETFFDRKARFSMLLISIIGTRRIRVFVGGSPRSRGNSLAFRARSWCSSREGLDGPLRPMIDTEFIFRDSGFALTSFLVCCRNSSPPPAQKSPCPLRAFPTSAPYRAIPTDVLPDPVNRGDERRTMLATRPRRWAPPQTGSQ